MTLEAQRVPEDPFGSLQSCLVEGDRQSEKRARRIKQRAVAVSIVLQSLALTALVLYPLLSKGERISLKNMTPIPPYAPVGHHRSAATPPRHGPQAPPACHFCVPNRIPPTIVTQDHSGSTQQFDSQEGDSIPGLLPDPGVTGGIRPLETRPIPPLIERIPARTERRSVSEPLQMAMLITRVDPVYPPLAWQIHREGRVELHAIISTEGTIESLEVISGDPFFIQSALAAVRQWRYRPTILNGRPIEVDTHITVIYTLSY